MSSKRADILAGLKTAFEAMKTDPIYNTRIAQVTEFYKNLNTLEQEQQPVIMIIDTGEEIPRVYDGINYQCVLNVQILAYLRGDAEQTLQSDANKLVTDIKTFIDAQPTIHAQVLDYRLKQIETMAYEAEDSLHRARYWVSINTQLRYYVAAGTF